MDQIQSTFDVNWDALSEPNNSEPNIVLQEVTDEFLRQYGLEQSDFDDEMFDMFEEVSIPAADRPTDMSLPPSPLPTTEGTAIDLCHIEPFPPEVNCSSCHNFLREENVIYLDLDRAKSSDHTGIPLSSITLFKSH